MRTAIVHYWLLNMRGGEKVVESLCRLLPEADIFTLFYDPENISPFIRARVVKTSFLNPFKACYRTLLPVMPIALESLDLRGYDLVISSESGPAKGVITSSHTRHVCYCHSPMRYLWDLYPDYLHEWTRSKLRRALMAPLSNYLRVWDFASAARVDEFVANSRNVQDRIWRAYRRQAEVIYPPVAVERFHYARPEGHYLIVSELVSYKRIDYAVRYFSEANKPLKVVGKGPEYARLKSLAGPAVEFCGHVPDEELRELYAGCRAVIIPGEEDFGLVAVEALASGKAVIALGRGGVLDSLPACDPQAAFLYAEPQGAHLQRSVEAFEREEQKLCPSAIQSHASLFSEDRFQSAISEVLLRNSGSREESNRPQYLNFSRQGFEAARFTKA